MCAFPRCLNLRGLTGSDDVIEVSERSRRFTNESRVVPAGVPLPGQRSGQPRARVFTRRKAGQASTGREPGKDPLVLQYDDLVPYFGTSQRQACSELGVGLSTMKRLCRRFGIKRWPGAALFGSGEHVSLRTAGCGGGGNEAHPASTTTQGDARPDCRAAGAPADVGAEREFAASTVPAFPHTFPRPVSFVDAPISPSGTDQSPPFASVYVPVSADSTYLDSTQTMGGEGAYAHRASHDQQHAAGGMHYEMQPGSAMPSPESNLNLSHTGAGGGRGHSQYLGWDAQGSASKIKSAFPSRPGAVSAADIKQRLRLGEITGGSAPATGLVGSVAKALRPMELSAAIESLDLGREEEGAGCESAVEKALGAPKMGEWLRTIDASWLQTATNEEHAAPAREPRRVSDEWMSFPPAHVQFPGPDNLNLHETAPAAVALATVDSLCMSTADGSVASVNSNRPGPLSAQDYGPRRDSLLDWTRRLPSSVLPSESTHCVAQGLSASVPVSIPRTRRGSLGAVLQEPGFAPYASTTPLLQGRG
mmetsp:Transcript_10390/g.21389  ORF Transcript_10390/g.21389 Transcript_10390/m.21389 type:complete len:534 (+) Transcript_10390:479-2080(+)